MRARTVEVGPSRSDKPVAQNGYCPGCDNTKPVFSSKWSPFALCLECVKDAEDRTRREIIHIVSGGK